MCTDVSKLYESLLRFRSGSSGEECFYYSFVQGNLLEGDILWLAYHIGTSGPRKLTSFRKVSFTAMPDLSRIEGAVIDWNFTYKLNVSCQWPWSATLAISAFQARGDMLTHADFYVRKRVFASPAKKVGDEYILEDGTETIFFPIYDADESFGTMILRSRENISIQIVDTEERCALFRGGMNYAVIRDRIVKISQVSEDNYLLPPGMTSSSSVSSSANQLQDTKPHTIDMVGPGHVGKCTIVASQTVTNDVTPMRLYKPRTTKRDVSPLRFPTTPVQNSFDGFLSMLRGSRSCTPDQSRDENAPVISTTSSTVTIDSGPVLPALKVCVMHVGLEVDSILDIIHRNMSRSRSLVPWLVLPTREMLRSTDVFDWQMRDARRRYDESMHTDHQELWDRRLERRWPILRELLFLKSQLEIPEISILDNLLRDAVMNRSIYQTKLVIMSLLKNSENTLTLISEARVILWLSIEAPPVLLRWVTSFF